MIHWIRKLLGLCIHRWEIIERHHLMESSDSLPHGVVFVLQCSHCGDIKKVRK